MFNGKPAFIVLAFLLFTSACKSSNSTSDESSVDPSLESILKNPNQLYAKMLTRGTDNCDPRSEFYKIGVTEFHEMSQYSQAERLKVISELLALDENGKSRADVNTTMDVLVDDVGRPDPWRHCYKIPVGSHPLGWFGTHGETLLAPDYSTALQRSLQTGFDREDIVEAILRHPQIDIDKLVLEGDLRAQYGDYFRKIHGVEIFKLRPVTVNVSAFNAGYPAIYSAVSSFAFGTRKIVTDSRGVRRVTIQPFDKDSKKYLLIKEILERSKLDIDYEFPRKSGQTPLNAWARASRDCNPYVLPFILAKNPSKSILVAPQNIYASTVPRVDAPRNALEITILNRKWQEFSLKTVASLNNPSMLADTERELRECQEAEKALKDYGFSSRTEMIQTINMDHH